MIDAAVTAELERLQIQFCLIGGAALAVWGHARYTADVDLLTLDPRILDPRTWTRLANQPEIRRADPTDPLGGVVRWTEDPPLDLILGRGHAARVALQTATRVPELSLPVASPLGLALLKLEAGSYQDRADLLSLVAAQRALGTSSWVEDIPKHVPQLSSDARKTWGTLQQEL